MRASQSASARSTIASNTGWTSVGDCEITCRILAVAVCCSSASLVSVNRRTFSIAITAWSAKVCSNSIWCGVNCPGSRRVTLSMPIETLSRRSGLTTMLRNPRDRAASRAPAVDWDSSSVSVTQTVSPARIRGANWERARGVLDSRSNPASPSGVVGVKPTRCIASSRIRQTAVECPPRSRFELAAIASNTGCTSSGDAAMTLRISAVAVWRSSASLVSLKGARSRSRSLPGRRRSAAARSGCRRELPGSRRR